MSILESKEVLVLGEADSFWTKRFIGYVLKPLGVTVSLITPYNRTYREYYDSNDIKTYSTYGNKFIDRIPKLRTTLSRRRLVREVKKRKGSIVIIQYAFPSILRELKKVEIDTLVITYWGSDLYRVNQKELMAVEDTVRSAKRIVVMTDEMKSTLLSQYKTIENDKVFVIDMGVSAFNPISRKLSERAKIKNKFFPKDNDKVILTIGYNADSKQQHDKVLQSISELPDEIRNKIALLLPMTYRNTDPEYMSKITSILDRMGLPSVVLKEFMDDEAIADVCIATDIFINAQTTDALSSSMIEQLYAGTKMYCGDWLKYSFLDNADVIYYTFSDFNQLSLLIQDDIRNRIDFTVEGNMEKLKDKCSWEVTRQKWKELLENLP